MSGPFVVYKSRGQVAKNDFACWPAFHKYKDCRQLKIEGDPIPLVTAFVVDSVDGARPCKHCLNRQEREKS